MSNTVGKIDLHMHTTASDGTDSPEELIAKVRTAGLSLFSVTDHDTTKSAELIPSLLGPDDPEFIRGVEFSCRLGNGEAAKKYHILGYGFDPANKELRALLDRAHGFRMEKAVRRLEFLSSVFGFTFPQDEVDEFLAMESPAKPHVANMMVKHGYASDIDDAVVNYINKREFEDVNPTPGEAIECILAAGGIPVLAHPPFGDGKDNIRGYALEARVAMLRDLGLQGLEGYYHKYTPEQREEVLSLAEKYGLYVTAGSDYHGLNKSVPLGLTNLADVSEGPEGLMRFLADVRRASLDKVNTY